MSVQLATQRRYPDVCFSSHRMQMGVPLGNSKNLPQKLEAYSIDSIDYAGIGNAPSHIQTLLIMPYGVMEKMESTSIPALFQPVQWFYCGKPGQ